MAQTIAEMIAAASKTVGADTPSGGGSSAPVEEASGGIEIEHQNIEHVQGQAKSGLIT